ncbi:MAG TPA: HipA family kinase [Blastocatellia bacterium]|nr:HipA family kinase [Blastocatellia bacterium]
MGLSYLVGAGRSGYIGVSLIIAAMIRLPGEKIGISNVMVRTVTATRYVTPLREGGSLPAIIEADDDGMYVLKFRGAGQGPKALIAELLAGAIGNAAGLPIPEVVLVQLDADLARTEPDPEIQDLIRSSGGLNLALDYLPGSVGFNPVADKLDPEISSAIVWFDAYLSNVDRTARNTNIVMWHKRPWLIDHGAALYFHHGSEDFANRTDHPFPMIKDHVLLSRAKLLQDADAKMSVAISREIIDNATAEIPADWLAGDSGRVDAEQLRQAYRDY